MLARGLTRGPDPMTAHSLFVGRLRSDHSVESRPRRVAGERPSFKLEIGTRPLGVALAMAAVIFAFRMTIDNSVGSGLSLLYVIPIVLVSAAYGYAAGAAAATMGTALVFLWADLQAIDLGAVRFAMRTLSLYAVPAVLWLARPEPGRGEPAPALHAGASGGQRQGSPPKQLPP